MIDVDAAAENTMVVFSAIKELRKDTEEGWKKLAVPLDQVIEANNAVRATLLFSSQRAAERLLALTNPCWSLPIGCSWFTEVESKALLSYTPLKVKIWR